MEQSEYGKTKEGEGGQGIRPVDPNDSERLGSSGPESKEFGFSGASRVDASNRPWTGIRGQEGDPVGGISSRLIAKLLEQRAEVLSRYEFVIQRKAEYEAKLKQIDRELESARELVSEVLELEGL